MVFRGTGLLVRVVISSWTWVWCETRNGSEFETLSSPPNINPSFDEGYVTVDANKRRLSSRSMMFVSQR